MTKRISPSINNAALVWIGVFSFLLLLGCNRSENKQEQDEAIVANTSISEPVYRDWAQIKQSGVLRMITYYSSGTYFLYKGIQVGFEYELVKEFAKDNDLALEVVVIGPGDNPYDLLNSGRGDIIAANYTITPQRQELVNFTRPYNLADQQIVLSSHLDEIPQSISEMGSIPISVRRNSSYYERLLELEKQGFALNIIPLPEEMDTEALLYQVSEGIHTATVADDNLFEAGNTYLPGLVKGPLIAERDSIAWAIRKNAPDFESTLNRFLYSHFRFDGNGVPKRSAFLNVLRRKYFEGGFQLSEYINPFQGEQFSSISPYDDLIKKTAEEFNLDWVMLTAIAAQESKFNPNSVSWAGAVGLMQVLPRFSEIPTDSLTVPEINIREGAKILAEHLKHYAYMDSSNIWPFALAAYNAGQGHLADARRLSIDHNENPNEWEDVSKSLLRLMQRKYYQNARYGFCRGIETVRYVNEILNRYNTYQSILAATNARPSLTYPPGILGLKTL